MLALSQWLMDKVNFKKMQAFSRQLESIEVSCSLGTDAMINREALEQLISSITSNDSFPKLKILHLYDFPFHSIIDKDILRWIAMIIARITENQLTCFSIEFDNETFEVNDSMNKDSFITINEDSLVVDIYQSSRPGYIELWIGRRLTTHMVSDHITINPTSSMNS